MSDPNFAAPTWRDFQNILHSYQQEDNPVKFLSEANILNDKLAQSLLIYGETIGRDSEKGSRAAYTHYVVNSSAPLPDDDELPEGPSRWAADYASSIGLEALDTDGQVILKKRGYVDLPGGLWTDESDRGHSHTLRRVGTAINRYRYGRNDIVPSALFDFNEKTTATSLANAIWLADMSMLAYSSKIFSRHQLELWGYDLDRFAWLESPETNTQAFVAGRDNHLIVAFRGTKETVDWLTDAKFRKIKLPNGRGRVHRGFRGAFESVWPQLDTFLKENAGDHKIFITGHSLGGALAQVAGEQLSASGYDINGVYLYGAPLVGNDEFAKSYNKNLFDKTHMYINNEDVVTRVPPPFLGYRRVGNPRNRFHFNDKHALNIFKPDDDLADLPADETGDLILTPAQQAEIDMMFEDALFTLNTNERALDPASGAELEASLISDHSTSNYLIKFASALVDDLWDVIEKRINN